MDSAAATRSAERSPSGAQWTISADGHEAVLVEVGGGLRAYRSDGIEHIDGYGVDELCPGAAGQQLAPWPNRIRDGSYPFQGRRLQLPLTEPTGHNAIHGLVNWIAWHVVDDREPGAITLGYELPAQPGYPWTLELRTRWSVGPDGLTAQHEVTNLATEACPFGFGVHPYLQLPGTPVDDTVLWAPGRSRLLTDGRDLPIGAAKVAGDEYDFTAPRRIGAALLDTAYGHPDRDPDGRAWVQLSNEDGSRRVGIWADEAFRWWQVFTGDTLTGERTRRSVAVEPMTCPPDAFRSGRDVVTLEPGETWRGRWGVRPGGRPEGSDGTA